jgi:hypothetical protein
MVAFIIRKERVEWRRNGSDGIIARTGLGVSPVKRFALLLLTLLAAMAAFGCSRPTPAAGDPPFIVAIAPLKPVIARFGGFLGKTTLPATVTVTYRDGTTAERPVTWELGGWATDPLWTDGEDDDITVSGAVEGTETRATLLIDLRKGQAEDLRLSAAELAESDRTGVMQRRADESIYVDASAWSPDHSVLALLLGDKLCVWPLGDSVPQAVTAVKDELLALLDWSFDGRYVSVHAGPSGTYHTFIAVSYPELAIGYHGNIVNPARWSPDTHEALIGLENGHDVSADLALLDVDSGRTRTLLAADEKTFCYAVGWASPGVVLYDRSCPQGGESQKGLTMSVR